jgi:hypothetical protein
MLNMNFESSIQRFSQSPSLVPGIRALAELLAVLLVVYMVYLYFVRPWGDTAFITRCYTNRPFLDSVQNGSVCIQTVKCNALSSGLNVSNPFAGVARPA